MREENYGQKRKKKDRSKNEEIKSG